MMPFIGRRNDGTIYGLWSQPQPNDEAHPGIEEVPSTNPELIEFLKPRTTPAPVSKAILDAVLSDPSVPQSLKALLNVLPDTQEAKKVRADTVSELEIA